MKSLQEFKKEPIVIEEEKSDYTKFDMLVRAGLANKSQLARLHRILDKMKEERPVFNPTDRAILQNLFNKMVGIITDNKQIFQRTRQVVREEVEKTNEIQLTEEQMKGDPPFVLVLKRKAIRLYPNKTKIALYYNDKLKKYFSIPYSTDKDIDAPLQAEQVEINEINEGKEVMDHIHDIVKEKQARKVKFANGKSAMVDGYTASAIKQVHDAVNDENKAKIRKMVHQSPEHFHKVASFAFSKVK
jgi:hypothetical protein